MLRRKLPSLCIGTKWNEGKFRLELTIFLKKVYLNNNQLLLRAAKIYKSLQFFNAEEKKRLPLSASNPIPAVFLMNQACF